MNILDRIQSPADLQGLSKRELELLAEEIRRFLVKNVSQSGGHLASNLGAVELTLAIHRVYDTSRDRLVFDVGHQSYVHKVLTGRKADFATLRQEGGLSGFPKPGESDHDAFIAGHASNSVSVALGMAWARTQAGEDYDVVALIGDGALTGGMSYEGLANAGRSGEPMVVILNDNGMSIGRNVGGMAYLLAHQRVQPSYLRFKRVWRQTVGRCKPLYNLIHRLKEHLKRVWLPGNIFDDLGYYYLGPVDGHDEALVETALGWAREMRCPVLLHVITKKGKGYTPAEDRPNQFHGVGGFDPETGALPAGKQDFSACFGKTLVELAQRDERICAVTAAMEDGTGLGEFARRWPMRFRDVGIAEAHAVAMCAGTAKQGGLPVFAVYSSFLQRGFDQLIHDIALLGLHVVFGVDRAGLVGRDGETHNGVFDVGYLRLVPHLTLLAPASYEELREMLTQAVAMDGPVALRYPRGQERAWKGNTAGKKQCLLRKGEELLLVGYGILTSNLLAAAQLLEEKGISAGVLKLNCLAPLDEAALCGHLQSARRLLVVEDTADAGCVGRELLAMAARNGIVLQAALRNAGDGIVLQGSVEEQERRLGLDAASIAADAERWIKETADEKTTTGSACI